MSPRSDAQALGRRLVEWFWNNKRTLPWRVGRDPYRVWVAEVMLQQTRVDTVVPRYVSFLERFPTVYDLAAADEDEVLKEWEGLGYYSRARNLRLAAREIVARYGGEFPAEPDELRKLPGIGRYTAAAVASIAFNRPMAAVDGNVLRVVARLYAVTDPINKTAVQRRIEQLTEAMIPPDCAADFTEALMELGALICTPGRPDCDRCPWFDACAAREEGNAAELPNRPKRKPPRIVRGAVAVVVAGEPVEARRDDAPMTAETESVLVTRRPSDGLLGGMWEFPWVETDEGATPEQAVVALVSALREAYGVDVSVEGRLPDVSHVFSHLEWRMQVFVCRVQGRSGAAVENEHMWVAPEALQTLAFGRAHRRIADAWSTGRESGWKTASGKG